MVIHRNYFIFGLPLFVLSLFLCSSFTLAPRPVFAQNDRDNGGSIVVTPAATETIEAPDKVEVQPVAHDEQIAERLVNILRSTEWFTTPKVSVREGVVFLDGITVSADHRTWAGNLARNTQDVVAVVNRIQVLERSPWDFTPALDEMRILARGAVQALPLILLGLLILTIAWFAARYTTRLARRLLIGRLPNAFLRDLGASLLGVPVFLLGLYLILQLAGLTRLALTVLGGTGLVGLIVGIGFRDIVENFLASILISTRSPFAIGDWIEVAGYNGLVQRVTTRGTMLMTFDGNYVRIPNAIVYKSNIVNYTVNPHRRLDFTFGISYTDSIAAAQATVLHVLTEHPAVLAKPEPLVLVENLGAATVDLRVYFWYDTRTHNWRKVKSSLIRLTKHALDEGGFTLPDTAREVIFPQGIPVQLQQTLPENGAHEPPLQPPALAPEAEDVATAAEGDLGSEEPTIQAQAHQARSLDEGENLLKATNKRGP
ncbi:mechanosensitive ion channel family protein [soil metagenome]